MGTIVDFPMWAGGDKRLLDFVLSRLPALQTWTLRWFDGVTRPATPLVPPCDTPLECDFTSDEIHALAQGIVDLHAVELTGELDGQVVIIEAVDSAAWRIQLEASQVPDWLVALASLEGARMSPPAPAA